MKSGTIVLEIGWFFLKINNRMKTPAISVITPIYNVKPFVSHCVESLMNQTFKDVEFIFVDDASTDGSIDILGDIIGRYPTKMVKIIHHERNMGLPAARKTGIAVASGEYVYNCDGDDWVEPDILGAMYEAVTKSGADYAYCDYYLTYDHRERYMKGPPFKSSEEALRVGYLSGTAKYNVWNKLIRRSLYKDVVFPVEHKKGGEDMIMFDVLSKATSIVYVPKALYHYVKFNENAISEKFSVQRLIDIQYNADQAIAAVQRNCPQDLSEEIAFFKLNVKLPFIISDDREKWQIWREWYPEANPFIMKNRHLPMRTRLVQWFAAKNLWCFVAIYNLIHKLLYRLLFQ